MNERTERFEVGERGRIELRLALGDITVSAGDPGEVGVELSGRQDVVDSFEVVQRGDSISIGPGSRRGRRWARADVHVTAPSDIALEVHAGSADVAVERVTTLRVKAASGDVRVTEVLDEAQISVASGDVTVSAIGGPFNASAAAGDIRADHLADRCECQTASGDIRIGHLAASGAIKAASGDIVVGRFAGKDLSVVSLSGDIEVGIPEAWTLDVELQSTTGDIHNRLAPSSGPRQGRSRLKLKTLSGDITLHPA